MTNSLAEAYLGALAMLEATAPRNLHRTALMLSEDAGDQALRAYLMNVGPDDKLRKRLQLALATWDYVPDAAWIGGTEPRTASRRELIYELLEVDEDTIKLFDEEFPIAGRDGDIVIADSWERWYTDELRKERGFYWNSYRDLLMREHWDADAVGHLNRATSQVVERLSDPTRVEAYQAKGLVIGYVQSGKTANFTGVIAKAIDAGYRLVIVLTGTTDLLRAQTQRRLDKELIGVENILGGVSPNDEELLDQVDYQDDPEWIGGRFVRLGIVPGDVGKPGIDRLTTYRFDYKSLKQGIAALDFPKREKHLTYYNPANLFHGDARIAVVKKNGPVLKKLVNDLKRIKARVNEIPTLIIDDESDQASINTSNPKKWAAGQKDRSAINMLISELLNLLPRAQYVGYTATPFANVFIDPSDAEDVFPKDFLIALDRPPEYMGARDFHDIDEDFDETEATFANSARRAYVRFILDQHDKDSKSMLEAMDAFVLSGAIKLYREERGLGPFRHHTMLVHEGMRTVAHKDLADRITALWNGSGYYSATAYSRLRALFDSDTGAVSRARAGGIPAPNSFDELLPYLPKAINRIGGTRSPVLIVNSDKIESGQEKLDFDTTDHVWRILVGGNKLARGFTVEGLTVSYYTRVTKQADTMMQMGRWFGFRKHYQDLVRLYTTPDLYEAFEAIVRDEEFFRDELRQYAKPVNGKPQVTPKDVPPLVGSHLPKIKPTAANKSYNRILAQRRTPNKEPRSGYPNLSQRDDLKHNVEQWHPILEQAVAQGRVALDGDREGYEAWTCVYSHSELLRILNELRWSNAASFHADLAWLNALEEERIQDWTIFLPQLKTDDCPVKILETGPFSLHRRAAPNGVLEGRSSLFGRTDAERIARPPKPAPKSRRGALLLYPMVSKEREPKVVNGEVDPRDVVMAFRMVVPTAAIPEDGPLVTFRTKDSSQPSAAIVASTG
ncbi:Z1 domain-containing protein [Microbispora rosea]|uniref:Z1 domain-containing protein n=1 Tax=Microbispora rosea TaxID=58117 RepID=UPI003422463F